MHQKLTIVISVGERDDCVMLTTRDEYEYEGMTAGCEVLTRG